MPNRATHVALGAGSGALAATHYFPQFVNGKDRETAKQAIAVTGLAAGGVGGRIPDLLEPPTHPNHRDAFHSVVAVGGLIVVGGLVLVTAKRLFNGSSQTSLSPQAQPEAGPRDDGGLSVSEAVVLGVLFAAVVGCVSHLLADSGTPQGLPLSG